MSKRSYSPEIWSYNAVLLSCHGVCSRRACYSLGLTHFTNVSNVDGVTYVIRVPRKIHGIVQAREAWHKDPNSPRDLLSIMNTHLVKMATDQRDKIWGFLGVSDEGDDLTKIDLTESVEEVYISFTQEFINKYKSLRIMQSAV